MSESAIAIVGVGYVGLPLAVGLANHHDDVIAGNAAANICGHHDAKALCARLD